MFSKAETTVQLLCHYYVMSNPLLLKNIFNDVEFYGIFVLVNAGRRCSLFIFKIKIINILNKFLLNPNILVCLSQDVDSCNDEHSYFNFF